MKTTVTKESGKTLITASGELDTTSALEFQEKTQCALEDPVNDIVMDCKDLEFMSSKVLRVLVAIAQGAVAKGRSLTLINVNTNVMEVLNITGLAKVFNCK